MFHYTGMLLAPGSVIEPGNWGRFLRAYPFYPNDPNNAWKLASELMLENVRHQHYPSAPSRMDCCFAFESKDDADQCRQHFGAMVLYEVEPVDTSLTTHRGAFNLFDQRYPVSGEAFLPHADALAHKFWRGQDIVIAELLLASPIRVIGKA